MQHRIRPSIMAVAALLCAVGTTPRVSAQGVPNAQASVPASLPRPLDGIQLTAHQRAAIAADWEQRRPLFAAITQRWRAPGGVADVNRAALSEFVQARNAAVRAILTPEQREQLDRNISRITELWSQRSAEQRRVP